MLCEKNGILRIVVKVPSALHRSFLAVACTSMISDCSVAVPGQQTNSTSPAGLSPKPFSIAKREGIIRIDVVVTDARGNPVVDLDPGNFTLLDGRRTNHGRLRHSTRP